jgi:murein L,D-transpeptidase YcbB/YkuD
MIRPISFAFAALAGLLMAAGPAGAEDAASAATAPRTGTEAAAAPATEVPVKLAPAAEALKKALDMLGAGETDEEKSERTALAAFYDARHFEPLWFEAGGPVTPKGAALAEEIKKADEWGLDSRDFALPSGLEKRDGPVSAGSIAADEVKLSLAMLKYGRYARGGRIVNPSGQLSSYLDRKPQLLKPGTILDGAAAAEDPGAYLRSLHPQHEQFRKLREKYLSLLAVHRQRSPEAKKLLANMEEWRWMPADMGEIYIWNNVPEFTQRVMKDGKTLREARIVAGLIDKQTPIFSRPLRKVTFKPTWIVPDSVKVGEILPDLMKGGHMMREYGLQISREGRPVDWHRVDWTIADIRAYDVTQPYQSMSVMGKFKFSFPNQHTVFMHDALPREKWMFKQAQRTYSHGCMRVANPMQLAEIILREDQGWDARRVEDAVDSGPLNNEIPLEHAIPVHITYFTALVGEDGKLHTFHDVYGHERRITQALEGKWDQIVKGRDHLAPVELAGHRRRSYARQEEPRMPEWRRSWYGGDSGWDPFGRGYRSYYGY